MPKKNFSAPPGYLDQFFSDEDGTQGTDGTHGTDGTQETQRTHGTREPAPLSQPESPTPPASKHYRLNLKLKAEYREYLERVSWQAHKSITQYISDLIESDMSITRYLDDQSGADEDTLDIRDTLDKQDT